MKLLITNPDAIINSKDGSYYPDIVKVLLDFNGIDNQQVVVISTKSKWFSVLDKMFFCMRVDKKMRAGKILIETILDELKIPMSDVFILGCKIMDVSLAANSKLILLRADYARANNEKDRIYINEYGISIKNGRDLTITLDKLLKIEKPWYYKCTVNEMATTFSLTNANTMGYRQEDAIDLAKKFQVHLKNGDAAFRDEFLTYFLLSAYRISQEFEVVDYWGIYPSSSSTQNPQLEYFKDKIRQSFNVRPHEPLLIRKNKGVKRHNLSKSERINNACDGEFDTIKLNDLYRGKLQNKTVCIIDDFSNLGASCETTRHLLEMTGIKKLIFITMGKFGKDYYSYDYTINGDPFGSFVYEKKGPGLYITGEINTSSDMQFIKSLAELIK
jgi:hypothetical protein